MSTRPPGTSWLRYTASGRSKPGTVGTSSGNDALARASSRPTRWPSARLAPTPGGRLVLVGAGPPRWMVTPRRPRRAAQAAGGPRATRRGVLAQLGDDGLGQGRGRGVLEMGGEVGECALELRLGHVTHHLLPAPAAARPYPPRRRGPPAACRGPGRRATSRCRAGTRGRSLSPPRTAPGRTGRRSPA